MCVRGFMYMCMYVHVQAHCRYIRYEEDKARCELEENERNKKHVDVHIKEVHVHALSWLVIKRVSSIVVKVFVDDWCLPTCTSSDRMPGVSGLHGRDGGRHGGCRSAAARAAPRLRS